MQNFIYLYSNICCASTSVAFLAGLMNVGIEPEIHYSYSAWCKVLLSLQDLQGLWSSQTHTTVIDSKYVFNNKSNICEVDVVKDYARSMNIFTAQGINS